MYLIYAIILSLRTQIKLSESVGKLLFNYFLDIEFIKNNKI